MDQNFLPPIFCCIFCDVFCSGRLKDRDEQEMLFLFRNARNVKVVRQVFPLFSVSDDDEQLMETQSKMSKEILLAVFCFWSIFAKVYFLFSALFCLVETRKVSFVSLAPAFHFCRQHFSNWIFIPCPDLKLSFCGNDEKIIMNMMRWQVYLIFSMSPGVMALVRSIKRGRTKNRSWSQATIFL